MNFEYLKPYRYTKISQFSCSEGKKRIQRTLHIIRSSPERGRPLLNPRFKLLAEEDFIPNFSVFKFKMNQNMSFYINKEKRPPFVVKMILFVFGYFLSKMFKAIIRYALKKFSTIRIIEMFSKYYSSFIFFLIRNFF